MILEMYYETHLSQDISRPIEDDFLKKVDLLTNIYKDGLSNFDTSKSEPEVTLKPKIWQILTKRNKKPLQKTQTLNGIITKYNIQLPCALTLKFTPNESSDQTNGELNIEIGHASLTIDNSTGSNDLLLTRSTLSTRSGKNSHLTYPTTNELSSFHQAIQTFTPIEQPASL